MWHLGGRPAVSLLLDEIAIATARLAEAGVESPRTDAELIAARLHGVARSELHLVPDAGFDPRFWDDIARREAREPLQHITGIAYFRYLELAVGPGVFVPRQETEVMTGWAIEQLAAMDVAEPLVADLGTGSGAIALSIAQEVPRAQVHAVEADPLARQWTERNIASVAAASPHTAGRVRLHAGDFGSALAELDGPVRPGRQQPALHPGRRLGAARGGGVRPGNRALGRQATGWTRCALSRERRAGCSGRADCSRLSTALSRAPLSTGCSPRRAAGGRRATTPTWPVATGSSPRPGP